MRGRASVVPILIAIMLASLALPQAVTRFSETIGLDFYHFWGVPVAQRLTGHALGAPYGQGERYQATLKQYATTINQPRIHAAQRFWTDPDFTGSPLLYEMFGVVSDDYTFSLAVFRGSQIVAFVGACVLLGVLYGFDLFYPVCFALISLLLYQPLLSDLRVANVGCLQLGAVAAVTGLASLLPRVPASRWRDGLAAVFLAALAALALSKPNIALVGVVLAVHLAVRHGAWPFVRAALPAAVVSLLLIIAPCLYFGSWTVWWEWFRYVYIANPGTLVRPIASGNYSTPLFVSTWFGGSVFVIATVLFVLLVASLVIIRRPDVPTPGRALEAFPATFKRFFREPHAPVAAGVLLTLATSPLSWLHYYVLVVVPSLWLLSPDASARAVPLLAGASVVMSAGIVGMALWGLGWPGAMPATIALSWVPLWAALLIQLRSPDVAAPHVAPGEGRTGRPRRPRK